MDTLTGGLLVAMLITQQYMARRLPVRTRKAHLAHYGLVSGNKEET